MSYNINAFGYFTIPAERKFRNTELSLSTHNQAKATLQNTLALASSTRNFKKVPTHHINGLGEVFEKGWVDIMAAVVRAAIHYTLPLQILS